MKTTPARSSARRHLCSVDIFGSVVPRSNASVVLIGTPERSDSTLRDQPIKDARELCRHWHQLADKPAAAAPKAGILSDLRNGLRPE